MEPRAARNDLAVLDGADLGVFRSMYPSAHVNSAIRHCPRRSSCTLGRARSARNPSPGCTS